MSKNLQPETYTIDKAIEALVNSLPDLKVRWDKYLQKTYNNYQQERLDYVDIGEISSHLYERIISRRMDDFDNFFDTLELILIRCSDETENLIVVGLIESLQNRCGSEINYYTGFDNWLKPTTKKKWDNVISFWEGNDAIENYKAQHPNDVRLIR